MPPQQSSPFRLTVEGRDDLHAVIHLLRRHGVDWDAPSATLPDVYVAGSVEKVLEGIGSGVRSYERFAIVVDADTKPTHRWLQIRDRLRNSGIAAPDEPDRAGTVLTGSPRQRIGVWLMPDNCEPGILENFLGKLVPEDDPCWSFAGRATDEARALGAPLAPKDRMKGILHTWLAWREQPGLPFGTALTTRVLGHDAAEALAFVAWFNRVFTDR